MTEPYFEGGSRTWGAAGAEAFNAGIKRLRQDGWQAADPQQQLVHTLVAITMFAEEAHLDLSQALPEARKAYAALRQEHPYPMGAAVTDGVRRGLLLGAEEPARGVFVYRVRFFDTNTPEDHPADRIALADNPVIELSNHRVFTVGRALEELAQRHAEVELATEARRRSGYHTWVDHSVLLEDLTTWSGASEEQLLAHLRPAIDAHRAAIQETDTPARLVAGETAGPQSPDLNHPPPPARAVPPAQSRGPERAELRHGPRV